jgi:Rrf2 family protein
VESSPGRKGGYQLARDPHDISMGQIVRYFDGILAPIGCVSVSHHQPCSQSATCRFRRLLLEIRNLTASYMDQSSLAQVFASQPVSAREVFSLEFASGAGI